MFSFPLEFTTLLVVYESFFPFLWKVGYLAFNLGLVIPSKNSKAIGLDYSSPYFYVDSNGNSPSNIHFSRESEKKLAKLQHNLSRKVKGSSILSLSFRFLLILPQCLHFLEEGKNLSIFIKSLPFSSHLFFTIVLNHFSRESEKKLAKLQHNLSRKVKGSSNYKKELLKIQKLHLHIANQRRDFAFKELLY